MITADIATNGAHIAISTGQASPRDEAQLRQVRGVQRVKDLGLIAPLYPDMAVALRDAGVQLSRRLQSYLAHSGRVHAYVDKQKTDPEKQKPLRPMPLKAQYKPYDHQVRAYNISLALLVYLHGWDEEA